MLLAVAVCEPLSAQPAPAQTAADAGIIAYVQRSTDDIHVISPDGTGDRVLWTNPGPDRDEQRDISRLAARRPRAGFLQRTRGSRARGTTATSTPSATMAAATGASPIRRPAPCSPACPRAR